jgi:hypothetical protein
MTGFEQQAEAPCMSCLTEQEAGQGCNLRLPNAIT